MVERGGTHESPSGGFGVGKESDGQILCHPPNVSCVKMFALQHLL